MSSVILGKIDRSVKIGKNISTGKGSVVKSGEIPDGGHVCTGDIVEKCFGYYIKGSKFPLTITQNYLSVGCVPISLDNIEIKEVDVRLLAGQVGVDWYRKHHKEAYAIGLKHAKDRLQRMEG